MSHSFRRRPRQVTGVVQKPSAQTIPGALRGRIERRAECREAHPVTQGIVDGCAIWKCQIEGRECRVGHTNSVTPLDELGRDHAALQPESWMRPPELARRSDRLWRSRGRVMEVGRRLAREDHVRICTVECTDLDAKVSGVFG